MTILTRFGALAALSALAACGTTTTTTPGATSTVDVSGMLAKAGTYDATWHATRWPWFPADIDWSYFNAAPTEQRIVALLNDDSNAVGQVHLGVVHLFDLASDEVSAREDALAELQFQTIADLRGPLYQSLETWSQFCVDSLDDF